MCFPNNPYTQLPTLSRSCYPCLVNTNENRSDENRVNNVGMIDSYALHHFRRPTRGKYSNTSLDGLVQLNSLLRSQYLVLDPALDD